MVQSIKGILFTAVLGVSTLFAAPGDLDTTFGDGGKVSTFVAGSNIHHYDAAIQNDGKILAAGRVYEGASTGYVNFALTRYNSDGSLDSSFGSGGTVTTDFEGNRDYAHSVAIQKNSKIVVAGYTSAGASGGYDNFALARHNSDGSLDSSFGSGGTVTTDLAGSVDRTFSVAIQENGKIVVAGFTDEGVSGSYNFALARYDNNGSMDGSFGSGGTVTTDFEGNRDYAHSVAIQGDGKIVVAGRANEGGSNGTDFALVRYNSDGSLDGFFGNGGTVTKDFSGGHEGAYAVAIQENGKIVVAGYAGGGASTGYSNFALVRYNSDGSLDTGFGGGGIVTTDFAESSDYAQSVAIQKNGKIVLTGYAYIAGNGGYNFALARYNNNGSMDGSFGNDGIVITNFDGGSALGQSVAIQENGKIMVAGYSDLALARYEGDPTLVPNIDVASVSLDFGDVIIGYTEEDNVIVSNTGTGDLTISSISVYPSEFTQTNNCTTVVPGDSCTVTVILTPVAGGSKTATLSIDSDDPDEPTVDISLTGQAKSPQEFADDSVTFIEDAIVSGDLEGTGGGASSDKRLNVLIEMIDAAKVLIDNGDIEDACVQLASAYKKTDGKKNPPDLVSGSAAEELAALIQQLEQGIGCL